MRIVLISLGLSLLSLTFQPPQKVFVIGDSISIQYGPYLDTYLGEEYVYDRLRREGTPFHSRDTLPIANGQDSRNVLKQVKRLLALPEFQPDILLLNCGLHDIKTDPQSQSQQVPLAEYQTNLDQIFGLIQQRKIPVFWVRTTPVVDSIHNRPNSSFHRYKTILAQYNAAADSLCSTFSIPQIDLHTFTESLGEGNFVDHVHFSKEVRQLQGAYLAGYVHSYGKHTAVRP